MPAPPVTISDAELVEHARGGDRAAFQELLDRHDERMRGLAYRLVAERPGMDEALIEAYVTAYKGLPNLRPGKDFGDWLYRITYNACVDEIRRRREDPTTRDLTVPAGPSTSEVVRAALAELPPSQRVTVVLVDGEGFHHAEVAEILGVAPGTVSSRLYRARTKLRRRLWDEVR
jgi:RNA polymerase sigma-70 factor (ECF subfamily)